LNFSKQYKLKDDKGVLMGQEKTISIGDYKIGKEYPPFIVAEMSGNHNQSLEKALSIVDAAAKVGAHALKLQTYTADTMTLDLNESGFIINDSENLWTGNSLYNVYKKASTPWEWHQSIFARCQELGLICFSSPFDVTSIEFLESLGAPAYKIASFENVDLPLIGKAAFTGKPLIISTGMASVAELDDAVRIAREAGCKDLILLKCTSAYPASSAEANLETIPHMRKLFDTQIGLSDHTPGIGVAVASVALGATMIEKHFTLNREDGGSDSAFSIEPHELKGLVVESKRAWQALGQVFYGPTNIEEDSLKFRRSLYVIQDMNAGETFTADNIKAIRPGDGLSTKYYDIILGKQINQNIKKGTPISWDLFG